MTPSQCRAARALLNMTQPALAAGADVGLSTVVDFEKSRRNLPADTIGKLRKALEAAGVELVPEDAKGVGVRFSSPTAP
ncbi:hypothetical protein ARD30_16285 [Bosea thiooxidans]|uniref:HTH cro/C1-type domain-containing protein n=2 Tax=Bosea thiooxidans TaxID=53254 RepID=A0A0Q3I5I4_9HYPH|nr:hypothetical protein ARD30_16285 [Bosea thiooxidans]